MGRKQPELRINVDHAKCEWGEKETHLLLDTKWKRTAVEFGSFDSSLTLNKHRLDEHLVEVRKQRALETSLFMANTNHGVRQSMVEDETLLGARRHALTALQTFLELKVEARGGIGALEKPGGGAETVVRTGDPATPLGRQASEPIVVIGPNMRIAGLADRTRRIEMLRGEIHDDASMGK